MSEDNHVGDVQAARGDWMNDRRLSQDERIF